MNHLALANGVAKNPYAEHLGESLGARVAAMRFGSDDEYLGLRNEMELMRGLLVDLIEKYKLAEALDALDATKQSTLKITAGEMLRSACMQLSGFARTMVDIRAKYLETANPYNNAVILQIVQAVDTVARMSERQGDIANADLLIERISDQIANITATAPVIIEAGQRPADNSKISETPATIARAMAATIPFVSPNPVTTELQTA